MHDLLLITKVLLKGHRTGKGESSKKLVIKLLGAGVGVLVMWWLFLQMETLIAVTPAEASIQAGLALLTLVNILLSLFTFPPAFYFSNDTKRLVVLPVKPFAITGAKLIDNMGIQVLMGCIFALPMAAAFVTTGQLNILQTVLFVLCAVFLLPMLVLLVIGVLTMILARLFPAMMNEDRYTWFIMALVLIPSIGFYFVNNSNGHMDLIQAASQQEWFQGMQTAFIQNQLASQVIVDGNMISLLLLAGLVAALVGIFMAAANALYLPSVTRLSVKSTTSRKVKKADIKSGSYFSNAAWTECKQVWRSPNFAGSIIPNAFMMPIAVGAILLINGSLAKVMEKGRTVDLTQLPLPAIAFLLGVASIVLGIMATQFAASAISRKGTAGVRFMCQMPQKLNTQLHAILLPGMVLTLIGSLLLLIAVNFLFNVPFWASLIYLAGALMGCLFENLAALLLDLLNPSLVWDTEASAVKNNINPYISLGINVLLIAAIAAPFAFLVVPMIEANGGTDALNLFAAVTAVSLTVLCAGLYAYMMKTARRHLMKAL
ncbi:MAG: hypothetical protein HUJ54_03495 [Erysipelotrichaceae bacterium]|nr:hypothetical protein [Erysipelotrichaceae bacterium]